MAEQHDTGSKLSGLFLLLVFLLAATEGMQLGRLGLVLGGLFVVGGLALAVSSVGRRRVGVAVVAAGALLAISGLGDLDDEAEKQRRRDTGLRAAVEVVERTESQRDRGMARLAPLLEEAQEAMRKRHFDEAVGLYRQAIHIDGLPEDEARAAHRDYRNANVAANHPEWTARAVEAVLRASTDDELRAFLDKGWLPPRSHRDNADVQAALRVALLAPSRSRLGLPQPPQPKPEMP